LAGVTPKTRYARRGDCNVAYQVTGEGDVDLVFVPGWMSHIGYAWEEPSFAPFLERLAGFSRLILLDRVDAAGLPRAVLFGISESGPMCALFAATHPRCRSRTGAPMP